MDPAITLSTMRTFSARETAWLQELDGIELAPFWRRALAFILDWTIVAIVLSAVVGSIAAGVVAYMQKHGKSTDNLAHILSPSDESGKIKIAVGKGKEVNIYHLNEHSKTGQAIGIGVDVIVPALYFGILLWKGKGRTPGKRLLRIRVVSIVHSHLTFWHSVERALGYGAAALEGGFGFVQFFIHPYRRCAQDRLAETIVVTERGYQAMHHRLHPPEPVEIPSEPAAETPLPKAETVAAEN
jgi:uncharacterized RDD family membrane protein YckC